MYSHYYQNGVIQPAAENLEFLMPSSHFEIWFRHHFRINGYNIASYAERVGETEPRIKSVYNGNSYPTRSILQDLNMYLVQVQDEIFYKSVGV